MTQETYRGLKPHFKGRCEDMKEFEASLGYMRDCLKTKQSKAMNSVVREGKVRTTMTSHGFPGMQRRVLKKQRMEESRKTVILGHKTEEIW